MKEWGLLKGGKAHTKQILRGEEVGRAKVGREEDKEEERGILRCPWVAICV